MDPCEPITFWEGQINLWSITFKTTISIYLTITFVDLHNLGVVRTWQLYRLWVGTSGPCHGPQKCRIKKGMMNMSPPWNTNETITFWHEKNLCPNEVFSFNPILFGALGSAWCHIASLTLGFSYDLFPSFTYTTWNHRHNGTPKFTHSTPEHPNKNDIEMHVHRTSKLWNRSNAHKDRFEDLVQGNVDHDSHDGKPGCFTDVFLVKWGLSLVAIQYFS